MTGHATATNLDFTPLNAQIERGTSSLIAGIEDKWRLLCAEGPCQEPFFQPECVAAYLAAFEPSAELLLLTAWRGDELRAVLPLVQESRAIFGISFKLLRSPVNVHSCRFDLIHGVEDAGEAAEKISALIGEELAWDCLELNSIPESGGCEDVVSYLENEGFRVLSRPLPSMPKIDLRASAVAREVPHYKSFRKRLPKKLKKLQAKGKLLLQRLDGVSGGELEKFYKLEQASWKGKEGSAIACQPSTRLFYDKLGSSAAKQKYFTLYSLELDGRPVAMHYGLTLGKKYYAPKVAFDESLKQYSPGQLLVMMVIEKCKELDLDYYELLGEMSEWKKVWANEMARHSSYAVFSKGLRGYLLYLKACLVIAARNLKNSETLRRLANIKK